MKDQIEKAKRTLTLERILNAPIKLVWDAWTQPEHIANWWGPPGIDTKIIKFDFKEGGNWAYQMSNDKGNQFKAFGTFLKIIEYERLESSANFKPLTENVTIIATFQAVGARTRLTFEVVHPTESYCRKQEKIGVMNGWGTNFGELEAYVKGLVIKHN